MKPRVHLVSATNAGGAGRAAMRLRHALTHSGLDTQFSVQRHPFPSASPLGGYPILGQPWWIAPALSRLLTKLDGQRVGPRSLNLLPTGRLKELNESNADVLNLHWLGSDTLSIPEVGRLTKPFVWTFHDMWAFCGTEHLASTDEKAGWRHGYPERSGWLDLDRKTWRRKEKHFPKVGFAVCPSQWLSSCVRDSALMHRWHIRTIPNPLDTDTYTPRPKSACRNRLGLQQHERILLFGAQGADSDHNKGFDLIREMIGSLAAISSQTELKYRCLIFGNKKPGPDHFNGVPTSYLGRLESDDELVTAYGAADVVIVPSRQENLPQVATEAQSCGRPVIAFDTTGLRDAIEHDQTGVLVPAFDTKLGAQELSSLCRNDDRRLAMETAARARAVTYWNPNVIAAQYTECFLDAISAYGPRQTR